MQRLWLCPGWVLGLGSRGRRLIHLLGLRMELAAFILITRLSRACGCHFDTCGPWACVSGTFGELSWSAHLSLPSAFEVQPFFYTHLSLRPSPGPCALVAALSSSQWSSRPPVSSHLQVASVPEMTKLWPVGKTWPAHVSFSAYHILKFGIL